MLTNSPVTTTLPMTDIPATKDFYENKLGLKLSSVEVEEDALLYEAGLGSHIYLYKRSPSKADHTQASFDVEDIEKEMSDLSQKGVIFEHYDMPGLKTDEKGVAEISGNKAAWFKDPSGNILSILQRAK